MVCFHPILTWTKRDNLASKKYYPLSLNCLARCRAEFWTVSRMRDFFLSFAMQKCYSTQGVRGVVSRKGSMKAFLAADSWIVAGFTSTNPWRGVSAKL